VKRLKALISFSRSLLPTLAGCGVVWAFLPMQIKDGPAYAEFVLSLWKHRFPFPWCHHVRMVIRDQFDAPVLEQSAAGSPRISTYTADFSPDAIRRSLEEEAGEDQTPLADRVNSCLMLAGIDYSHGRYDRAIQQYEVVHKYAAATQNPTLAAIALNGLGDVLRSKGLVDEAGHMLQAAIAPAALAPQPPVPVLMDIYAKLGEVRHSQERWAEAEVFLKGAADFALLLRDPSQRLRSWKLLGEAQYKQDKTTEALKTWFAGAVVAGKLAMDADYDTFVQYLRNHYEQTSNQNDLARVMARVGHQIANHEANAGPNTAGSA
jgi:tetratricopeptide (TPR) repeat protein